MAGEEQFTAALRRLLDDRSLSYRALAELCAASGEPLLARGKDTIGLWVTGKQPMKPDEVFALERALGVEPGALSRFLGYVPVGSPDPRSAREALKTDLALNEVHRQALLAMYDTFA